MQTLSHALARYNLVRQAVRGFEAISCLFFFGKSAGLSDAVFDGPDCDKKSVRFAS